MDYLKDKSTKHLCGIAEAIADVPDFVKTATVDSDSVANLPDHLFADPIRREFPIDGPGHVWLGYAYCKHAGVHDQSIMDSLKSAAKCFQIGASLIQLDTVFEKVASTPKAAYAVYIDFGQPNVKSASAHEQRGGLHGFYPISNPEQVRDSSVAIANQQSYLPLMTFVEGCRNIVKTATYFGIADDQLPPRVLRYGVDRLPDVEFIKIAAQTRQQLTGDATYAALAEKVASNPLGTLDDLAVEWHELDLKHAAVQQADAWTILNSGEKRAHWDEELLNKWLLIRGAPVPKEAVETLDPVRIKRSCAATMAEKILGAIKQAGQRTARELSASIGQLDEPEQKQLLKLVVG